jgi:hypothetical protein
MTPEEQIIIDRQNKSENRRLALQYADSISRHKALGVEGTAKDLIKDARLIEKYLNEEI